MRGCGCSSVYPLPISHSNSCRPFCWCGTTAPNLGLLCSASTRLESRLLGPIHLCIGRSSSCMSSSTSVTGSCTRRCSCIASCSLARLSCSCASISSTCKDPTWTWETRGGGMSMDGGAVCWVAYGGGVSKGDGAGVVARGCWEGSGEG